jgi:NPCBM/NEW2 domain
LPVLFATEDGQGNPSYEQRKHPALYRGSTGRSKIILIQTAVSQSSRFPMSAIRFLPAFLLVLAPAVQGAVELNTLKNETIKGELVSVSAKEIVIDTSGGKKVTTAVDQVLNLTFPNPLENLGADVKYALMELTDGTQLKCATYTLKGKDAKLTLLQGQTVDLPIAQINWVLNEAHVPANMKEFKERILAKKGAYDLLAIKTDDVVNAIQGTIGDADDKGENIEFIQKQGGTKRTVAIGRPFAMFFQRAANPLAKPIACRLHDTTKNLVFASEITHGADGLTIVTSCGATIKYPNDKVARLDYSVGKLTLLSQLAPASVEESIKEEGTNKDGYKQSFARDQNLDGGKIRLAGVEYRNGLSLHSTTEVVYDLDGEYRELKAMVGIDDDVSGDGQGGTILKIYDNQTELLNWTLKRSDKQRVRSLNLNIKDVKKLRIVVTSDDPLGLDLGYHLSLGDARVTK